MLQLHMKKSGRHRFASTGVVTVLATMGIWLAAPSAWAQTAISLNTQVDNFQLKDVDGVQRSLESSDEVRATVVIFMGWECPMVKLYVPRLNELQKQFADEGVRWLAINSNQHDSLTELQAFARRSELDIPLLKDPGNRVADAFGATRTPEVFLLDAGRRLRYHGRIDDQYSPGQQRPSATREYLEAAIRELLAGDEISVPRTEPAGCIIGRVLISGGDETRTVTFHNQISRILQSNCASCHRAGEIGPFELNHYEEVAGWAGMIQEVVNEGRMPPWHASPEHGTFSNDCRLSPDEVEMINTWVESGAPAGNPADAPQSRTWATGWQIGEPDLIVPMDRRSFRVPATGTVEYKYFEVDPGFTEDKWVSAAECRPGNRAVIHHIIVGIRGQGEFGEGVHSELQSDWIAATAPGSPPMRLPDGYAKRIPAGSNLIFQVHYTPNGTATRDLSSVGLKFVEADSVTHRVFTQKAINEKFRIPPGAANHRVPARPVRFDRDVELISLFPHMHLRGKSFRYTAHFPDGTDEVLLDVPRYDFNWQNAYVLAEPRKIPAGTRLRCVAHFDNSDANLANPDPTRTVRWGDQTWEEMMIGYFNVAIKRE